MAFNLIRNVSIKGISACVPEFREDNREINLFDSSGESEKFISATGVEIRHLVKDSGLCASDLCFKAATNLLENIGWHNEDIDCLIFVSQTADYILPATSCILQERLGLSKDCYAIDISMGCSGWVYGLSVISSLISGGMLKKGLLLVGDTTSVTKSPKDKSTYPLFGDAGTATAVDFDEKAQDMMFHFGTDGRGAEAIIIPDGGFRNFFNADSFKEESDEDGIIRNRLHSILNGPAVFTFGISRAPKSVNSILEHFDIDKETIDYFVFHQANLFMNEKIRTKLKIEPEKVPYSLGEYGNTSSASIPLTIVNNLGSELKGNNKKILSCAFGVGLSWASVIFDGSCITCSKVTEL